MSFRFTMRRVSAWLLISCFALSLAECSKKDEQAAAPKRQVIAHLGKDEVTIHELEEEFRSNNIPADQRSDEVVRRFLGDIIQRKLLVQQALAAKLDREPTVLLDIGRSRERILAGVYLQREVANKAATIGRSEVDKYIASHAAKFSKRLALIGEQITFPLTADAQSVLVAAKDAKTLDEIDKIMTGLGVFHNRTVATLDSGAVPEEVLAVMQAKKTDNVFSFRAGSDGVFFQLKKEESRPLTGEDAEKAARQQLTIDLFAEEGKKTQSAAFAQAKFEGDYARIMSQQGLSTDEAAKPEAK